MQDEARYRRQLRVQKIKAIREGRKPSLPSSAADNLGSCHTDSCKSRAQRNRESALKSRKRKEDEMHYLQNLVYSLESELSALKKRLSVYENFEMSDENFHVAKNYYQIDCKRSLEPAVFKI